MQHIVSFHHISQNSSHNLGDRGLFKVERDRTASVLWQRLGGRNDTIVAPQNTRRCALYRASVWVRHLSRDRWFYIGLLRNRHLAHSERNSRKSSDVSV